MQNAAEAMPSVVEYFPATQFRHTVDDEAPDTSE